MGRLGSHINTTTIARKTSATMFRVGVVAVVVYDCTVKCVVCPCLGLCLGLNHL